MAQPIMVLLLAPQPAASSPPSKQCTATLDKHLPAYTPADFHFSGNIRKYYITAEEIDWDYAPSGWDNWLGLPLRYSPRAQSAGYTDYGTQWRKAVYRGYTDDSFTTKTTQPEWQGTQGPTIRAEVGDMIEILFLNRLSHNFASIHSMGLAYSKEYEGSVYPNLTSSDPHATAAPGDAVAPGECVVYKWLVPDGAAPSHGEPANMHGYHSYISMQEDMSAGLVGPQFTYQRGMMERTMSKYREFSVLFQGLDESLSFMAAENARRLKNSTTQVDHGDFSELIQYGNTSFWRPQMVNLRSSNGFDDAPAFYVINGYVFANTPTFKMCTGDKVIWYVYGKYSPASDNNQNAYRYAAQGEEVHVFHLHGNSFTVQGINQATKSELSQAFKSIY